MRLYPLTNSNSINSLHQAYSQLSLSQKQSINIFRAELNKEKLSQTIISDNKIDLTIVNTAKNQ